MKKLVPSNAAYEEGNPPHCLSTTLTSTIILSAWIVLPDAFYWDVLWRWPGTRLNRRSRGPASPAATEASWPRRPGGRRSCKASRWGEAPALTQWTQVLSERRKFSQCKFSDKSIKGLNLLQNWTMTPFLLVWPSDLHFKLAVEVDQVEQAHLHRLHRIHLLQAVNHKSLQGGAVQFWQEELQYWLH